MLHFLSYTWCCPPLSFQPSWQVAWHCGFNLGGPDDECECLSHVYRPFGYPFWERDCSRPLSGQVDSRPSRLTESLTLPPERWPSWSHRGRALLAHHDLLGGVSGGQPPFLWSGTLRRQANLGVYPDSASDQRCDPRLGSPMGKMVVID